MGIVDEQDVEEGREKKRLKEGIDEVHEKNKMQRGSIEEQMADLKQVKEELQVMMIRMIMINANADTSISSK